MPLCIGSTMAAIMWDYARQERLCAEVAKHPLLFDRKTSGYSDPVQRSHAWRVIGRALNYPDEECHKQWRTIRDKYVREVRQGREDGDTGMDQVQSSWPLFRCLGFLRGHIQMRRNHRMLEQDRADKQCQAAASGTDMILQCDVETPRLLEVLVNGGDASSTEEPAVKITGSVGEYWEHEESHEDTSEASDTFRELQQQEMRYESPVRRSVKRRQTHATSVTLPTASTDELPTVKQERVNGDHCHREHIDVRDCDVMFLLSLKETLKSLPPRKKRLAQLKFQQVLYDLEFGDDVSMTDCT
ncbi:transcription factor Adf-1-like [Ornithodoros turicata]|uniref:transcription factor Adf-1-like n=1 Tax=Ornithodoros turicata TaxID=34597 RepID=UPI00313973BC